MTKRFGNFADSNSKKPKTNENLDELWGDDWDAKDAEDCFILATQVCEQDNISCTQRNNVTILPSYNSFKQKSKPIFTSTQSDPELNQSFNFPSTSKVPVLNGCQKELLTNRNDTANGFKRTRSFNTAESSHLDPKIKKLQEQYLAKEGEVSILRGQLKEIQTNKESEQNKKEMEWSQKLTAVNKELSAVKSELEFKNLEIANLKQKVLVVKLNNFDTSLNVTQSPYFNHAKTSEKCSVKKTEAANINYRKQDFKIQPIMETEYPLQKAIPENIFAFSKEEKYLINIKNHHMCRNTIPFLQNQMSQELINTLIRLQPKVSLLNDGRQLNFDYVYCEMAKLMKCSPQEIELEENYMCINKILCMSEQLLYNLLEFLQQLEQNTAAENSQNLDTMYLENRFECLNLDCSLFDTKQWCDNEMGMNAKQSIMCISELLPYSDYLRGYLLENKRLIFNEKDEECINCLPITRNKLDEEYSNNFDYLNLFTSLVNVISKLKKSKSFPGLLSSITLLLNKICLCSNIEKIRLLLHNIVREMVFCCPNVQVLLYLMGFLKTASLQKSFVDELCKMPSSSVLKVNHKERILYYNEDTCVLQVLCIILEEGIVKMDKLKIGELYSNIANFISNSVKCNPRWLFYQEEKHCDCLCKIVKLYVDVMYQIVEKFHKMNQTKSADELLKYLAVLENGRQILHILNFKAYDLIVKYVATYAQYKDIIKSLLDLKAVLKLTEYDVELLEDINITDEIPMINNVQFDNIALWN